MTPWILVASVLGVGALMLAWGRVRARAGRNLDDAVPVSSIDDLEVGRFRVVGRIVPIATTRSAVDGANCVYAEVAEYRTVGGSRFVPLLREVDHGAISHPFFLDDETGRILVDPATALIECATVTADGGLTAERRLRAGEEVSLVANFRQGEADREDGEGPYRARAQRWEPVAEVGEPPRLSHRTEDRMVLPPPDDFTAFLGGAGGMMLLFGSLLAFVTAFVL